MIKLFKKKETRPTAIHLGKLVEKAFDIDGIEYYQYKDLLDMPRTRYLKMLQFSTEVQMRIDSGTLGLALEKLSNILEPEADKTIHVGEALKIIELLKEKLDLLVSIEATYRLLSCVYFTKEEDLTDYDYTIGDRKIEAFKKEKVADFFLTESARRYIKLENISTSDLEASSIKEKFLNKILKESLTSTTTH